MRTLDQLERRSLDACEAEASRDMEAREARRQNRLERFAEDELEDFMASLESVRNMPSDGWAAVKKKRRALEKLADWVWGRWERT